MTLTIVHPAMKQIGITGGPAPSPSVPRSPLPSLPLQHSETAARISQRLQTSLDPEQVVRTFAGMLEESVPFDGMRYDNQEIGIHVESGRQSRHSCAYTLIVEDEAVGEIAFFRGRKFSSEELEAIENLTSALAYPLRNAVLYQRAIRHAKRDPLTGLYNRFAMEGMIPREFSLASRNGTSLAMLVIDIDHFKSINDTHGHGAGDKALRKAAECIQRTVREADLAFRYGGEEFVTLLTGTDLDHALTIAERLRRNIEKMSCDVGAAQPLHFTVSIGVAEFRDGDTPNSLLHRADKAMYKAKQGGRNRVEIAGKD